MGSDFYVEEMINASICIQTNAVTPPFCYRRLREAEKRNGELEREMVTLREEIESLCIKDDAGKRPPTAPTIATFH